VHTHADRQLWEWHTALAGSGSHDAHAIAGYATQQAQCTQPQNTPQKGTQPQNTPQKDTAWCSLDAQASVALQGRCAGQRRQHAGAGFAAHSVVQASDRVRHHACLQLRPQAEHTAAYAAWHSACRHVSGACAWLHVRTARCVQNVHRSHHHASALRCWASQPQQP
jgi:hypothetical protein